MTQNKQLAIILCILSWYRTHEGERGCSENLTINNYHGFNLSTVGDSSLFVCSTSESGLGST